MRIGSPSRLVRHAVTAAVLLSLLATTACSRSGEDQQALPTPVPAATEPVATATADPPPAPPPQVDPCALVTHQEAEELAQTPLQEAAAFPQSCTYTGPPEGPLAQVEVYVGDGAKQIYDTDVNLGHEFTEIPDLGDEGFVEDGMVFFHVGGYWVGIRLVRLDDWSRYEQSVIEVARTAADRL